MKLIGTKEEEGKYVLLTMESDPKVFRDFYHSRIFSLAQNINIAGFRKGKAPLPMVIKHLKARGHWESELEKVLNKVVDTTVERVLAENKDWDQKVFGYPIQKTVLSLDVDSGLLTFEAKFEVFPKAIVGDYSKIPTLIETRDVNSDFWPVLKDGEAGDKDVVSITMEGLDSDKNPVIKYCYDLLEVDMEHTKLKKEFVDVLRGVKVSDKKELTIKDGKKDIHIKISVILVREKKKIDESIGALLGFKENTSLEVIKEFVRDQYEIYNFVLRQRDLLKWMLSDSNKIDPIPVENIKIESYKLLNSENRSKHDSYSLKHAFHEQINNLKSSLVVDEISKMENMKVTDEDRHNLEKDLGDNPWKYGHLTLDHFKKMDEESVQHYVMQFKVLKLLSENWKFSN